MPQPKIQQFNTSQAASPAEIIEKFQRQHLELCAHHPATVRSQYGTERESAKDYEGRVIFEFFQNAIDRADKAIVIHLEDDTLTIANDGQPFSIYEGTRGGKKSDFHSLCTIYDSSKKPGESVGNKGVGFKSVWSISKSVTISSNDDGGEGFAFKLMNPLIGEAFENPDIARTIESLQGAVPSFYFPKAIDTACQPAIAVSPGVEIPVQTRISIKLNPELDRTLLEGQLEELRGTQLLFIELLKKQLHPDFAVYIIEQGKLSTLKIDDQWFRTDLRADDHAGRYQQEIDALQNIRDDFSAQYSNLPATPNVSIAFPPAGYKGKTGIVYTYLPTKVNFGFNVLVHADFVLDSSRQSIPPNAYNNQLLKLAILLFTDILLENERFHNDPDFFKYLTAPNQIPLLHGQNHRALIWDIFQHQGRLRPALEKVYGPEKIYPESSYGGLITMIKAACQKRYGEHYESWHIRIRPFIKMFCGKQVNIIPLSGGGATFIPDPDENYGHLFLKEGSRDLGFDPDTQLQQIPEIKITVVQDLRDPIFTRWALRELTIYSLLSEMRKVQKKYGQDDAVHEKIFLLAYSIAGSERQMDFASYFSSAPREEREISRLLIPAGASGWHPAIAVYHGTEMRDWIDHDHFQAVDLDKCQTILSAAGYSASPSEILNILSKMGMWNNKFPLKWIRESTGYHFELPWKQAPGSDRLKSLISNSLPLLSKLEPAQYSAILAKLKASPWFTVTHFDGGFPPAQVFLFAEKDTRKLPDILKEQKSGQYELLYRELGIHSIEDTQDEKKLLSQLKAMAGRANGRPTSAQAELYRSLSLSLSRIADPREDLSNFPILYKDSNGFAYQTSADQVWFLPAEHKRLKTTEMDIKTAYFSDDIRRPWVSRLNVNTFDPRISIVFDLESKRPDQDLKKMISESHLAVFFALAEEGMGEKLIKEQAYERWMRLEIFYSDRVSMQISQKGLQGFSMPSSEDANVCYKPLSPNRRADSSQTSPIAHDLKGDIAKSIHLSKFSAGIADSVFRNQQLTETFRAYLDRFLLGGGSIGSELISDFFSHKGITLSDIEKEQALINASLLDEHDWNEFIEILKAATGIPSLTIQNWTNPEAYRHKELRYQGLVEAVGAHAKFQSMLMLIDPRAQNRHALSAAYEQLQAHYYLTHGTAQDFSKELFLETIASNAAQLDQFHFNVRDCLQMFGVQDFPDNVLEAARLKIQDGLSELSKIDQDEEPLMPGAPAEEISMGRVGQVDAEKAEKDRKAQHENGIRVESGLLRKFMQERNPELDLQLLKEIRVLIESERKKGIKGNLAVYLEKLDEAIQAETVPDESLRYFLHAARSIGDGLGYDLFLPEPGGDPLFLYRVEVKSARGGSKKIYFSRNEIRRIAAFSDADRWRLWFNDRFDAVLSAQVKQRICDHWTLEKKIRAEKLSYLTGDKWMLEIGKASR